MQQSKGIQMKTRLKKLTKSYQQIEAIYLKDLFQIIFSPMFLTICGFCCFLWSFNYVRSIFLFAQNSNMPAFMGRGNEPMDIHRYVFIPLVSQMNLLLVFIIPALTMRLFSEEKKLRTFDLLMSSPLNAIQMVLGKFFAAYKASLLLVSLSFVYIAITALFTDFQWLMPLTLYLGVILLVAVYVSLGLLASSLTSSLVLSVILGVVFNLFIWFVSQASDLTDNVVFTSIMDYLSLGGHLMRFAQGMISIESISFFIVTSVFFIFLTKQVIETHRWR